MRPHAALMRRLGLALPVVLAFTPGQLPAQTIWVEGERPTRASVNQPPSWYDQVKADQLSGGKWISHYSDDRDGQVEYVIQAPATARYAFWVRANPVRTRLSYSIGRGPWVPIDMTRDVVDKVNVAAAEKSDLGFLGWKRVGELVLAKGRHTIRFRMSSEDHHHGALDAFVLTTRPFKPSGAIRPGETQEVAATGTGAGGGAGGGPGTWQFLPPGTPSPRMRCSTCATSTRGWPGKAASYASARTANRSCWATVRRSGSGRSTPTWPGIGTTEDLTHMPGSWPSAG